jgi:uncharacterized protein (TIGR03437 family)
LAVTTGVPRLLSSCDSIFGPRGDCHPLITHADGSLVTRDKPAVPGETITVYALGRLPSDFVQTGYPTPDSIPAFHEPLAFSYRIDAGDATDPGYLRVAFVTPVYSGVVAGYVGLLQHNFTVPPMPPRATPCTQSRDNAAIANLNLDGATLYFCVAP